MKKEKTTGPVVKHAAGYLRSSFLNFPAHCSSPEMKAGYLTEQREVRQHELRQMAKDLGQVIDFWYEDMGVSGRGKFLASRTGFEAMTLAARTGLITDIYAWDLARLFRNLVQQELWLTEMTALGVIVHVQDLPYAVDPATRTLQRQQLGMINEYQAERVGSILAAVLSQHVAEGRWVGRSYGIWGLRYDPASKGYLLDETTAPYARRMFEVFNASGGSASQTVRRLNCELRDGHPSSLAPPMARRWDVCRVLRQIRSPLYRRRTRYSGNEYDALHLIPEVIPPDVLAATDALLAAKQPVYDECAQRCADPPDPYVFARRLRCAECGGNMQAYPCQGIRGPLPGLRVHWICQDALQGGECAARFRLPQYRLNALLDRALRSLFSAAQQQCDAGTEPEWNEEAKQKIRRERLRLQASRLYLKRTRLHILESYAQGLLTDVPALKQRLAALEIRLTQTEAALQSLRPVSRGASPGDHWAWSELGRQQKKFEAAWAKDWWLPRDSGKAELAADLGLLVSVRIHPRARQTPNKQKRNKEVPVQEVPVQARGKGPYKPRASAGVCEIVVFSPAFHAPELSAGMSQPWQNEREYSAGQYSAGQYSAGQYSAGQYSAGQYSAGQYSAGGDSAGEDSAAERFALECSGKAAIIGDGLAPNCFPIFDRAATLDRAAAMACQIELRSQPLRVRETDEELQRYQAQLRPANPVASLIDL